MGYTVTLFDGTTHTIQGEGTQADPWIIDCIEGLVQQAVNINNTYWCRGYYKFADEIIEKEQELPVAGDTAEDIARKKKTIDMNRVAPQGYFDITTHPTIKTHIVALGTNVGYGDAGAIDGNGCTIKNWYVEVNYTGNPSGCIVVNCCVLENLNIENMYINGTKTTNQVYLISIGSDAKIKNCKFSIMTNFQIPDDTSAATVCGINYNPNSANNYYMTNCSFNFRNIASYMEILRVTNGGNFRAQVYNCVFRAYSPLLPYCKFSGANTDLRYHGMFQISNGVSGPTTYLDIMNCKVIYETLNLNNKGEWGLSSNLNLKSASILFKNCVFELINNNETTATTAMGGGSFTTDGKSLIIKDRMGTEPTSIPTNFTAITKAQSINKNYLLSLLFPLMWEDE